MASSAPSQVLCGPFLPTDFPGFQAAIDHLESQWRGPLPTMAARVAYAAVTLTSKFNRTKCRISARLLQRGLRRNRLTGFSGLAPFVESVQSINESIRELVRLGIFVVDELGRTAIDYSITAADLVADEEIYKSVRKRNSFNPKMRTREGVTEWGMRLAAWLLPHNDKTTGKSQSGSKTSGSSSADSKSGSGIPNQKCENLSSGGQESAVSNSADTSIAPTSPPDTTSVSCRKQENTPARSLWKKTIGNQCLGSAESYSLLYRTTTLSGDKSPSSKWDWLMSKASELKELILASAKAKQDSLTAKRKGRMNFSDMCNLFEEGWRSGQRERDQTVMPGRLVARDRALLKTQIIGPARDAGIDPKDFAYWIAVNWDGIGATFFKKAKSYPAQPAFAWLVRCLETYSGAYAQRDGLDLSGLANPSPQVSQRAVAQLSENAIKLATASQDTVADLQAQLREAYRENETLKRGKSLPIEDDPVYARASKLASRRIVIGSYDDEESKPAVRRKLKRLTK